MSVTVPTGNFVGALADVIPFACTDKDLPFINAVRIEWDGDQLHTLATDMYAVGISSYAKDDDTWGVEVAEDDLFTDFNSGDDPWSITISLDDAKEIVSDYKLAPKLGRVPLTVDYDHEHARLTVKRGRETGHPAKRTTVEALPADAQFPDVRQVLADASVTQKVMGLRFDAKRLAVFSKVRPTGPLELTFTGETSATLVAIGDRFVGAVMPVKVNDEAEAA
ncbi:hypothetical protein Drose_06465 [Dactylosporangium roseum]|uniref:Uncharacterized protein n=1 Tax=Dactylosporangium roseum TaxID=47989 RepID=A0ABY5Z7A3_9ACTN|nr:hypothetical protein [Dactylosporangium roseum]UWZ37916.1 hypothetical protein Drose_06465 [Dactylosporangium roseum]